MIRSPLIAKIKRTSVLVSTEKRLAEDLDTMKRLVELLEKETDILANYKPLAERQSTEDKEGDIKMESPVKENGGDHSDHIHRGTKAVQTYLDAKLPAEDTDESRLLRVCIHSNPRCPKLIFIYSLTRIVMLDHYSCPCPWICTCNIFAQHSTAATIALLLQTEQTSFNASVSSISELPIMRENTTTLIVIRSVWVRCCIYFCLLS